MKDSFLMFDIPDLDIVDDDLRFEQEEIRLPSFRDTPRKGEREEGN